MDKKSITLSEIQKIFLKYWKKYKSYVWKGLLLLIAFISIALFFRLFNTPLLYSETSDYKVLPLDVFKYGLNQLVNLAVFIPLAICAAVLLIKCILVLRKLGSSKKTFANAVQSLLFTDAIVTAIYFIVGLCICTFYNAKGRSYNADPSFSILIWQIVLTVFFALVSRTGDEERNEKKKNVAKWARFEMFVYTEIAAVFSFIAICSDILEVNFISPAAYQALKLNGYKVLTGYETLGKGFQIIAFILLILLIVAVSFMVLSLVSFLGRSKMFFKFSLASLVCSGLTTLLIGLTGKYYEIVTQLNANTLFNWISQNIYAGPEVELKYQVKSSSILWFVAVMILIAFVVIRKPYTRGTMGEAEISVQAMVEDHDIASGHLKNKQKADMEPIVAPKQPVLFDPCPAFTELDGRLLELKTETEALKDLAMESPSLPGLVQFVVDYARNSRLHLSYSQQDIAAFVAGLGSTRLTILQGMSGTGKTSLPKIFCEAVFGECAIVEVESSWRDKHELLGYYNEFSRIYTPKKFTQALYQAALNVDRLTFIVLDELNLSRIEYYFSDFLSLMENEEDKRQIKLLNTILCKLDENGNAEEYLALTRGHTIKIPKNVWFVGTANRDESTFEISDKVYDRAHTMNFNKRAPRVLSATTPMPQKYLSVETLLSLFEEAERIVDFRIESCAVIHKVEELLAPYNISFGNRIANQIESFVKIYACCFSPTEQIIDEAVETILLSKVVSKLEYKNVENKDFLAEEFEKLKLHRCAEFVRKLNED